MSEKETPVPPPIVLDLQPYGEKLTFDSVDQIEQWLNKEEAGWKAMQARFQGNSPGYFAVGAIQQRHTAVRQVLAQHGGSSNPQLSREQLPSMLAAQFPVRKRPELYIPIGSAAYDHVVRLLSHDEARAGFVLALLLRLNWQNRGLRLDQIFAGDPTPFLTAIVDAEDFKRGVAGRAESEASALITLRQEWLDQLREHKGRYETEIVSARANLEARNAAEKLHDEKFDGVISAGEKQLADELAAKKAEFEALKETFAKHLSLKASVSYWRRRGWVATGLTILLLLAITGSGGGLVWYLDKTVDEIVKGPPTQAALTGVAVGTGPGVTTGAAAPLPAQPVQKSHDSPAPLPRWYRFWIAPVIFLLGGWGIRMLSRLLYANYQTAAASFEKATMVQSFLALMKDAQGLPPGSIGTLLNAIYHSPGTPPLSGEPILDPDAASAISTATRSARVNV